MSNDFSVQVVHDSIDTPIWINNSCCGCQLFYSVQDVEELISQLESAIGDVQYKKAQIESEARREAWEALSPDERASIVENMAEVSKKVVNTFFSEPPCWETLRKRYEAANKENK